MYLSSRYQDVFPGELEIGRYLRASASSQSSLEDNVPTQTKRLPVDPNDPITPLSEDENRTCTSSLYSIPDKQYQPPECNKKQLKYLKMVKEGRAPVEPHDIHTAVVPPELETVCYNSSIPSPNRPQFTYIHPIKKSCFCDLAETVDPVPNNLVGPFNFSRTYVGMHLSGMEVKFLPDGYVNHLTDDCVESMEKYPELLHLYRKIDPRLYKASIFVRGSGTHSFDKCLIGYNEMQRCLGDHRFTAFEDHFGSISKKSILPVTMRDYEEKRGNSCFVFEENLPETFTMSNSRECEMFFSKLNNSREESVLNQWIVKNTATHGGKGVEVVSNSNYNQWLGNFRDGEACSSSSNWNSHTLVQRYHTDVATLHERKFDLRTYMFIARGYPRLVYVPKLFYARLAGAKFDASQTDLAVALTNRSYAARMGWSMEDVLMDPKKLNLYMKEHGVSQNDTWVEDILLPNIKRPIAHLANTLDLSESTGKGRYRLFGVDFLVLNDFSLRIIEVNAGPVMYSEPSNVKLGVTTEMGRILSQLSENPMLSSKEITTDFDVVLDDLLEHDRFDGVLPTECL